MTATGDDGGSKIVVEVVTRRIRRPLLIVDSVEQEVKREEKVSR